MPLPQKNKKQNKKRFKTTKTQRKNMCFYICSLKNRAIRPAQVVGYSLEPLPMYVLRVCIDILSPYLTAGAFILGGRMLRHSNFRGEGGIA